MVDEAVAPPVHDCAFAALHQAEMGDGLDAMDDWTFDHEPSRYSQNLFTRKRLCAYGYQRGRSADSKFWEGE